MRRWWGSATIGDRIAVVGLVITILGVIPAYITIFANKNGGTSPTAQTTVSTIDPKIEAARNKLVSFPDNHFSDTCDVQEDDDTFEDDLAYVFCAAEPEVGYLSLTIYDTTFAMNDDFNGYGAQYANDSVPVRRDTKSCRLGQPSKGTWAYRDDAEQKVVGRFACFIDNTNVASILWSYDKHKIFAIASRNDKNLQALYKWWDRHWSTRP